MSLKKKLKKAKNKPKYVLVEDPSDEKQWLVKLTVAPWTGILYKYVAVKPSIDEENDRLVLSFQYDIIKIPKKIRNTVFADEQKVHFEELLGKIAFEIYEQKLKENPKKPDAR